LVDYIFIDNLRGFSNTFIPIRDVNFLVGENSTGKSSILSVLKLISSHDFWLKREFNVDEFQLGHFRDIVSIDSENQDEFKIGFFEFEKKPYRMRKQIPNGFVMTFVDQSGLPGLYRFQFFTSDLLGDFIFTPKQMRYLVDETRNHIPSFNEKNIKKWAKKPIDLNGEFKTIRGEEAQPLFDSPLYLDYFIQGFRRSKKRIKQTIRLRSLYPPFRKDLAWLAPIRSRPKRTYDSYKFEFSPEGEHTPYLIRQLLRKKETAAKFKEFLRGFGRNSNLFIAVEPIDFTTHTATPFELHIKLGNKSLGIIDVGYGVSQALPLIVEFFYRPINTTFAVQQPEIHLHPKAQAALGDIIYKIARTDKKMFFIETHSDYLVDRFRNNIGSSKLKKVSSQVLFFERTENGNKVHAIPINGDGSYSSKQPKAFRKFFVNEEIKLLNL
jgi:hypothetical protein